ncbi:hypothetical protein K7432_009712 [Basidiobolus ranarum]|uniref:Uncharacterized protein n=1 Tax=Basidiobolus ranarum TaxID=34480 RepID=A0ABR2VWM5_9FUNG
MLGFGGQANLKMVPIMIVFIPLYLCIFEKAVKCIKGDEGLMLHRKNILCAVFTSDIEWGINKVRSLLLELIAIAFLAITAYIGHYKPNVLVLVAVYRLYCISSYKPIILNKDNLERFGDLDITLKFTDYFRCRSLCRHLKQICELVPDGSMITQDLKDAYPNVKFYLIEKYSVAQLNHLKDIIFEENF